MKFFVFPPVALVPFHSAEIFSACVRAVELRPASGGWVAAEAKERVCRVRRRASVLECIVGAVKRPMLDVEYNVGLQALVVYKVVRCCNLVPVRRKDVMSGRVSWGHTAFVRGSRRP